MSWHIIISHKGAVLHDEALPAMACEVQAHHVAGAEGSTDQAAEAVFNQERLAAVPEALWLNEAEVDVDLQCEQRLR